MGYNKSLRILLGQHLKYLYFIFILFYVFLFQINLAQSLGFVGDILYPDQVQDETFSQSPSTMILIPMQIHLDHYDYVSASQEGILQLIQEIQRYIQIDIVAMLEQSLNKRSSLTNYLADSRRILNIADVSLQKTMSDIGAFNQKLRDCNTEKQLYDHQFLQAVRDNNDTLAEKSLQQSLVSSRCVSNNRVQSNALQTQYNKLVFHTRILRQKYNYISLKQDQIYRYFPVLKTDLLRDLTAIASQLQRYSNVR